MIDHDHINHAFCGFQLQPKLLLDRSKERWGSPGRLDLSILAPTFRSHP